jgi:hypothetical protein
MPVRPLTYVVIQVFIHAYEIGVGSLDAGVAEFIACNPAKRVVEAVHGRPPKPICGRHGND